MFSNIYASLAVLGLATLTSAFPTNITTLSTAAAASFSCSSPVSGLSATDCSYMSQIGMAGQGTNARTSSGHSIWLGSSGPNLFKFYNKASPAVPIILILWDNPAGDYQSSFMNVRTPKISYSIPAGGVVTISLTNGVSGGWTALYNHKTTLSQYGQIYNTWGEFTTGNSATVDISREIHMAGNSIDAKVTTGCTANMNTCAFVCKSGDTCGTSGSYNLVGCTGKNAAYGTYNGNPSGGCQGWSNGGQIDASFY